MITITKKESLFLSVYHTVWMLHEAKTARLVITLYRHITDKLPTSYRHITNCRPTVGRLSADCRPTDSLCFGENLSAVCRPTDGRQTADRRPTNGRQSANRRPTVGQQTADRRPTVDRQSADRFFGELFFTITAHVNDSDLGFIEQWSFYSPFINSTVSGQIG